VTGLRFGTLLCLGALLLPAQELRDYERKVTEFTLANGLHFILLERRQVPVVSFHTYVNAGSAQDPAGQTGLAHMMERLAFTGTETVGTKNWPAEKKALEELDAAYDQMEQERNKGSRSNPGKLATLQADAAAVVKRCRDLMEPNEYRRAFQENGGVGVSSKATPDAIETSYSLPSNRIELWFLLESQRLIHPVFRNFYEEREGARADIANTVETKSLAKLPQTLLANAFEALPYRNPMLGWPSDVTSLRRSDAKAFFDTYFVPGNMVISIVGDVDPANAQRLAERYFGPMPAKPLPPPIHTEEPPQFGPKTVVLRVPNATPFLMMGYKRPGESHRDDVALDVIGMILGDSRTGWMYKELVELKGIAQGTEVLPSFPSSRYSNLFVLSVLAAGNHTVEENQKAVEDLLARLKSKPVDEKTLVRVKNVIRARIARRLGSNEQLAAVLPAYYVNYGDWRAVFSAASEYNRVTAEDVQQVALRYFVPAGRTVAYFAPMPEPGSPASRPGGLQ